MSSALDFESWLATQGLSFETPLLAEDAPSLSPPASSDHDEGLYGLTVDDLTAPKAQWSRILASGGFTDEQVAALRRQRRACLSRQYAKKSRELRRARHANTDERLALLEAENATLRMQLQAVLLHLHTMNTSQSSS